MHPTMVILVTGHPGTGKSTLVRYLAKASTMPIFCRDEIKEILYDTLGWSTVEWSKQLGAAAMTLLYRQVEILLEAHTDHMVEANFDPKYANAQWHSFKQRFNLQLIQVRCECDPAVALARCRARVLNGARHPGHHDEDNPAFHALLQRGPIGWIEVESERISVNTTELAVEEYAAVAQRIVEMAR